MNPFDWAAGPFLTLYVAVAAATLLLLRHWRNNLPPGGTPDLSGFDTVHIAYLAGGPERAMDTALVGLFEAGAAALDRRRGVIRVDRAALVPPEFQPFRHVSQGESGRRDFHAEFAARCERIRTDLARRGLVPSADAEARFRTGALAVLCGPLLLGACKVVVGLQRDRPVGILTALLVVTAVLGAAVALGRPSRSQAGSAALARLRRDKARAARAPLDGEVALAFALSGSAVLAGREYRTFLHSGSGGSSDSSGDGGGSGGGDGGGGCGGCSG